MSDHMYMLCGNENNTETVSLTIAEWRAVTDNIRRAALQFEAATGVEAKGLLALIQNIKNQLAEKDIAKHNA